MLAVDSGHRKRKIGSTLVKRAIDAMIVEEADEVIHHKNQYKFRFHDCFLTISGGAGD